jgi:hemerythrin-like domain-containing protein
MNLREPLEQFHREHQDILRFLQEWEQVLARAACEDPDVRIRALQQLRDMRERLGQIQQHCSEEERSSESVFRLYLDEALFAELCREHARLQEFVQAYLEAVAQLTTPPPAQSLVTLGRSLVEHLRQHIALEERLLEQIRNSAEAEERILLRYTQAAE